MVIQKNELFSGTIKENLRWGNENATDEEIEHACRLACADEFIRTFPDKYDTHIEQGGTNVSGGQKQRCACARALVTGPKLILADEPTGALDSKSSLMLMETFHQLNTTMCSTILMVTHDAFSASWCKRILFLKDGQIFHELVRGGQDRRQFLNEILDVLALTGGELNHAD